MCYYGCIDSLVNLAWIHKRNLLVIQTLYVVRKLGDIDGCC